MSRNSDMVIVALLAFAFSGAGLLIALAVLGVIP